MQVGDVITFIGTDYEGETEGFQIPEGTVGQIIGEHEHSEDGDFWVVGFVGFDPTYEWETITPGKSYWIAADTGDLNPSDAPAPALTPGLFQQRAALIAELDAGIEMTSAVEDARCAADRLR